MVMTPDLPTGIDSDYQPLRAGKRLMGSTRISGRRLYLSGDVYERLGKASHVSVRTSVWHAAFALRPAERCPTSDSLKVSRVCGGTVSISIVGTLVALRRQLGDRIKTAYLRHQWVGDTLIVDCSALPMTGEG